MSDSVGSPSKFLKKLIAEENRKKNKFANLALGVLIFLVSAILIGKVVMANRLIEASAKLRSFDQQIEKMSSANNELSEQLREKTSVSSISDKAKNLGFVEKQEVVSIKPKPVAVEIRAPLSNNVTE